MTTAAALPAITEDEVEVLALELQHDREHADDAERLTRVLARRAPQTEQLPDLLLLVAVAFRRAGNIAMHEATMGRLRADFPESDAARNSALAVR